MTILTRTSKPLYYEFPPEQIGLFSEQDYAISNTYHFHVYLYIGASLFRRSIYSLNIVAFVRLFDILRCKTILRATLHLFFNGKYVFSPSMWISYLYVYSHNKLVSSGSHEMWFGWKMQVNLIALESSNNDNGATNMRERQPNRDRHL